MTDIVFTAVVVVVVAVTSPVVIAVATIVGDVAVMGMDPVLHSPVVVA